MAGTGGSLSVKLSVASLKRTLVTFSGQTLHEHGVCPRWDPRSCPCCLDGDCIAYSRLKEDLSKDSQKSLTIICVLDTL
jgi:hypothetical protein